MFALLASLIACPPPLVVQQSDSVVCILYGQPDNDGDGWTVAGGDCDDADPEVNPGAAEVCDRIDNDCDGNVDDLGAVVYVDADGDGYRRPGSKRIACSATEGHTLYGRDCDDNDPTVHAGADELCDGKDNDCDRARDEDLACGS